jgi:hypothetical protein
MVLRIKELLYEDQYTIAGAKKRLTSEIRGASKLKVVTPEMGAQVLNTPPVPQLVPAPAAPEADEPSHDFDDAHPEPPPAAHAQVAYPARPEPPQTDEARAALRSLREQLRDLMLLLEAGDSRTDTPRR